MGTGNTYISGFNFDFSNSSHYMNLPNLIMLSFLASTSSNLEQFTSSIPSRTKLRTHSAFFSCWLIVIYCLLYYFPNHRPLQKKKKKVCIQSVWEILITLAKCFSQIMYPYSIFFLTLTTKTSFPSISPTSNWNRLKLRYEAWGILGQFHFYQEGYF